MVSEKDIAGSNKINLKTALVLGQKLTIKTPGQQPLALRTVAFTPVQPAKALSHKGVASSVAIRSIDYTVKQGDSLAQISRKFNVSIADLRKWNPPTVSNSLTPGKKLKVILNT